MPNTCNKAKPSRAVRFGEPPSRGQRGRTWLIIAAFCTLHAAIGGRLVQLHAFPSERLLQEEEIHKGFSRLVAPRGEIFDRNKLLLATDRKAPSLWVDPRMIHDPKKVASPRVLAAKIAPILDMEEEEIFAIFSKRDGNGDYYKDVWLKRWVLDLDQATLDQIVEDGGGAIGIKEEPVRYYPQGDTASHLLGFVNRAGDAAEGVEAKMDEYLKSTPGVFRARVDRDRRLLESETLELEEPQGGENVYLTIDTDMQHFLENALERRMEECEAPRAMGLMMDPYTGALLALANRPAFDPNEYSEADPALRKNSAVLDVFEPGSSFKIVTASAALELGLVTPQSEIFCENGYFVPYGRHPVRDTHKLGIVEFWECFAESSNIGTIKVAALLGPDRLDQWIRRFGFGQPTSHDFQTESNGIFRERSKWSGLSMGALPIGQEISVTMPQLARAFAVIANGGTLVEPHFIDRAVDRGGNVTYKYEAGERKRILSPSTAATMRELCHQVVLHGTGQPAEIAEYRSGGKTGTAQMQRNAEERAKYGPGYSNKRYTAVYAGFAPVTQPRIVCVIVIPEPMAVSHYGGTVCGPVFAEVVREALIKMNVPEEPSELAAPPVAVAVAAAADMDTVNERKIIEYTNLSMGDLLESFDSLELVDRNTDGVEGMPVLPSFYGMTKRQVKERLGTLGITWDPQGVGWVVAQNPGPGTPLSEVKLCGLTFARKALESSNPDDPE